MDALWEVHKVFPHGTLFISVKSWSNKSSFWHPYSVRIGVLLWLSHVTSCIHECHKNVWMVYVINIRKQSLLSYIVPPLHFVNFCSTNTICCLNMDFTYPYICVYIDIYMDMDATIFQHYQPNNQTYLIFCLSPGHFIMWKNKKVFSAFSDYIMTSYSPYAEIIKL